MKRWQFFGHRWLGIPLCAEMALWFLSGMVMLYVGYPKLSTEEHPLGLAPLQAAGCCLPLAVAVHARNGQRVAAVHATLALASARHFAPGPQVRHLGLVNEDAWTHWVSSGLLSMNRRRVFDAPGPNPTAQPTPAARCRPLMRRRPTRC